MKNQTLLSVAFAVTVAGCQTIETSPELKVKADEQGGGLNILPAELVAVSLTSEQQSKLSSCTAKPINYSFENVPVIQRVEGFTSRMSGYKPAEGAPEVERFVFQISEAATLAHMQGDDDAKGRILLALANWARSDGLIQTESCVSNGNISSKEICKEWRKPDGSDLSAMKDATFVTMFMSGLKRTYELLLKDSNPQLVAEHKLVDDWLGKALRKRLKTPDGVYFGLNMGWYWPSIDQDIAAGNYGAAQRKVKRLLPEMTKLILSDGSIKDRTTRGDRSLWYHFSALSEIMVSMEYARSLDVPLPVDLEDKLHLAVTLFLNGVDDHKYMSTWASERHNSKYDGVTQDWRNSWMTNGNMGTMWLYAYPFYYPNHPNSARLRKIVPINSKSATTDVDFGFGVGCLYNAADIARGS